MPARRSAFINAQLTALRHAGAASRRLRAMAGRSQMVNLSNFVEVITLAGAASFADNKRPKVGIILKWNWYDKGRTSTILESPLPPIPMWYDDDDDKNGQRKKENEEEQLIETGDDNIGDDFARVGHGHDRDAEPK